MKLKNIEFLVDGNGKITLGRAGPVACAAIASDEDQALAVLVRHNGETLQNLLKRLDAAIGRFWEEDFFVDEINS